MNIIAHKAMNSNYLAPFFWYAILRAAFSRLRPSKSSTINSTSLALFFLYAIIRSAFRDGFQAVLHTPEQLTELEATHVNNYFLPSTILFTKKQQDLFHDRFSQDYVECSEHSTSIEIPIYIFDETLYTWKIVEKVPTFYVRGNTFENDVTKERRCKRPRKCNGHLYYLRHIRSCAVSNQCQCSVSGYMKSSIRKDSNDTIIIMKGSYGGRNTIIIIVIMQRSYRGGNRDRATFGMLFSYMQALIDKIKFYFEMILFSASCTSPGDPIHVNFDVLSLSMTQAIIRAPRQGKFVPRTRRRFISGGGGDSNAGNVAGFDDTPQNYNGFDAHFSRCQEVLQIMREERNGHCGILALQRTKRRYLGSPNHNVVSEGRQELVDAYRKHRAAFLRDHGSWFDVKDEDINRRIRIHLAAKKQKKCLTDAWVNAMDLVIWSMETGQIVYVVRHGEAHVDVFSGIGIPCECKVPLTAFTPGPEDIVLYFVDGVHFDTLLYRAEKISISELTPNHSSKFLQVNVCIQFSHAFFFSHFSVLLFQTLWCLVKLVETTLLKVAMKITTIGVMKRLSKLRWLYFSLSKRSL